MDIHDNEDFKAWIDSNVWLLANDIIELIIEKEGCWDGLENSEWCPECDCSSGFCEKSHDVLYEPQEIMQWYIVSPQFYNLIKDMGEPVYEWGIRKFWGRTCCGQALSLDCPVQDAYKKLEKRINNWITSKSVL